MTAPPSFFMPYVDDETAELQYAKWSAARGLDVVSRPERIYSITFVHDGGEWTATVGELLRGESRKMVTRRGQRVEQTTALRDAATVMAIFPGSPYIVYTDKGRDPNTTSRWLNPFMAGQPTSVIRFSTDPTA